MLDEHAEWRAPVAKMILSDDRVAAGFERTRERVANDRAAEMADVHLLRDVRRRVVDNNLLGGSAALEERFLALPRLDQKPGQSIVAHPHVDEAGAGDLDLGADIVDPERGEDGRGEVSGVLPERLGEVHHTVRLEVGSIRAANRGIEQRVLLGNGAERRCCGCAKPPGQYGERVGHEARTVASGLPIRCQRTLDPRTNAPASA